MKIFFIFFSFVFLLSPILESHNLSPNYLSNTFFGKKQNVLLTQADKFDLDNEEDDFDIDEWFKKMGIETDDKKKEQKSVDKKKSSGEELTKEEAAKQAEIDKKTAQVADNLYEFNLVLAEVTKAVQSTDLFGIDFVEKITPYIIAVKAGKPTPKPKPTKKGSTQSDADFLNAVADLQGAIGLQVLIPSILYKKVYRTAIASKKHEIVSQIIESNLEKLSRLKEKIEQLSATEEPTEFEKLQKLLNLQSPFIEKKSPPQEIEGKEVSPSTKEKERLESELLSFYKNLSTLINGIKKVFDDPEVKKTIEAKRKEREKLPPEYRAALDRSERYTPSSRKKRWSPYKRTRDYGRRYSPTRRRRPIRRRRPKQEAADKKLKDTPFSQVKKNRKKKKEQKKKEDTNTKKNLERKNFTNLLQSAIDLIKKISSMVKPDSKIIDPSLKNILSSQNGSIRNLGLTIDEINKRKGTAYESSAPMKPSIEEPSLDEEETDSKKKMTKKEFEKAQKKKDEKQKAAQEKAQEAIKNQRMAEEKSKTNMSNLEQQLYKTFVDNAEKFVTLCKYGHASVQEQENGRYAIVTDDDVSESQQRLRKVYGSISSMLDGESQKTLQAKEASIKDKITKEIEKEFSEQLEATKTQLATLNPINPLLKLSPEKLTTAKNNLLRCLQWATASKNQPVPVTITEKEIGDKVSPSTVEFLKQTQDFSRGKFSPALQKLIFDVQMDRARDIKEASLAAEMSDEEKKETPPEVDPISVEEASQLLQEHLSTLYARGEELTEAQVEKRGKKAKTETTLKESILEMLSPEQDDEWKKFMSLKKIALTKKARTQKTEKKDILEELRATYQYDTIAKNLNELDQINVILKNMQQRTGLWETQESTEAPEIVEALWSWQKPEVSTSEEITTISLPNPQICDVRTGFWQVTANSIIDELREKYKASPAKEKQTEPFTVPEKISTGLIADLSNLEAETGLKKLAGNIKRSFKHLGVKLKRLFKKSPQERSLLLIYNWGEKTYYKIVKSTEKIVFDKANTIADAKNIEWENLV